jgi:hypothetical protein
LNQKKPEDHTFKPKILKKKFPNLEERESNLSKWEQLYITGKEKQKARTDKDKLEIEKEKNASELTFQPNSHKPRASRRDHGYMSPSPTKERIKDRREKAAKEQRESTL